MSFGEVDVTQPKDQHQVQIVTKTTEKTSSPALLKGFSFSFFMTNAILTSFLPTYFVSLGFGKTQIGLLYSIGPMISIVSNLFWGLISDKYQSLKKTILALLIGQLCLALILFQVDTYLILFILMIIFYFFQTPLISLNDSQLLLHVSSTGKSYASFRVWGSIGFAFSALCFGLLLQKMNGNQHLIAFLVIGTIVCSMLIALFLKDSRTSVSKIQFSGLFKLLFSKKLIIFLSLVLIISIAHRANDAFFSLYLHELGANQSLIGYSWTISSLSEIPIFLLLSRYGHRFKELPLLSIASFAYVIRFYLVSITTVPLALAAIQSMHSITFGIFFFTALRYMMQLVPDQYRATGQAIFSIIWSGLAGLISSLVGGIIFEHWGGHVLYMFSGTVALIASLGFLLAHFKNEY
jgi:PPP family 3-phenylpropionic acid transporter